MPDDPMLDTITAITEGHGEQPSVDAGDGATLLDTIALFYRRFIAFQSVQQADAVALWTVHTWAFDASDTTPRLAVQSSERESGKTRLLEVAELLVREPMQALDASPAALFRSIAAGPITFLVDEVDTVFASNGGDNDKGDVRAILNAGYRRGAVVPRADPKTKKVERCPVFAPVALAGIGTLPDTVQSRCIVIGLRRRKKDEPVERFRRKRAKADADPLRNGVAGWAAVHVALLADLDPASPDELGDRMQDCWESLFAIADAAGGDWPARARDAAIALSSPVDSVDDNLTIRLLADIREVFDSLRPEGTEVDAQERVGSKVLAEKLADIDDAPWADWYGKAITPTAVARLLRGHAKPHQARFGEERFRGYFISDFEDSWIRYLRPKGVPETPGTSGTPVTPQVTLTSTVTVVPAVPASQGCPSERDEPERDVDDAVERVVDQLGATPIDDNEVF